MTDKQLRRLSRAELIDIIFQLQQDKERLTRENIRIQRSLTAEIERLSERLNSREIKISSAGTLADAAVTLTGLLECAQAAAELYLHNIEEMKREEEARLEELRKRAAEMSSVSDQTAKTGERDAHSVTGSLDAPDITGGAQKEIVK